MLLASSCVVCLRVGPGLCRSCTARLDPSLAWRFDGPIEWTSLFAYDEPGRRVIAALKFANHRDALGQLGSALAAHVATHVGARDIDAVTWAPTSPQRRRRRGFDQAELLARRTARELAVPCQGLLVRPADHTQTGRNRVERADVRFEARLRVAPRRVLVVDDVRTTGATLRAAAEALRRAGTSSALGAVVAERR